MGVGKRSCRHSWESLISAVWSYYPCRMGLVVKERFELYHEHGQAVPFDELRSSRLSLDSSFRLVLRYHTVSGNCYYYNVGYF
jgi:hypothetical protein